MPYQAKQNKFQSFLQSTLWWKKKKKMKEIKTGVRKENFWTANLSYTNLVIKFLQIIIWVSEILNARASIANPCFLKSTVL